MNLLSIFFNKLYYNGNNVFWLLKARSFSYFMYFHRYYHHPTVNKSESFGG